MSDTFKIKWLNNHLDELYLKLGKSIIHGDDSFVSVSYKDSIKDEIKEVLEMIDIVFNHEQNNKC